MKKIILFLIFCFIQFSNSFSQPGWIVQTIGNPDENFSTLKFFNPNTGMVISGYAGNPSFLGRIFRTTNAGQNWIYNNFNSPDAWLDGFYFDENNFVLVGQRGIGPGIVAIYTNNVRSDYIISPLHGNITALTSTDWLNANTGFVGGWDFNYPLGRDHYGRVLRTTNQGVNWIDISPNPNSDVPAIKFFNLNTGYIIDGSYFKKTTNSGQNWTTISSILLTQSDFHLITKDTFYLCGDIGYVRISSDSGYTWQLRPVGYNVILRSIKFINSKTGWTCGDSGYIFRTTNAGINWQKQNSGTSNILLNTNIINENNLWIGGSKGIVLKTTTGGVTFVKNKKENILSDYKLYQNYPNPFNSTTKIKFEIKKGVRSKKSGVKLIIYDITGKEIATLVNEQLNSGTYDVNFDGNKLPSGIYIYKLSIGDFVDTKKLILLK
jgi:photosystem II stability/assembly factor-like uncharacterized protein